MISTATTAGFIENKNLSSNIIESKNVPTLGSQFNIFAGKGSEKKLFSLDNIEAGVYAELGDVTADDTTFAEIVFDQKRVASAIEISKNATQLEDVGLEAHVKDMLAKRNLKGFAKQAFGFGSPTGSEVDKFQSILGYNDVLNTNKINGTSISELTGVTVANIDTIYGEFAGANEGEAIFVVDAFATVNALVIDGKSILIKENRVNGSIGTIYGIQVYVQPMNSKAKLVLMNPKAYGISVSVNSQVNEGVNHINDKIVFAGNAYAMGKVCDPNAIKIIK